MITAFHRFLQNFTPYIFGFCLLMLTLTSIPLVPVQAQSISDLNVLSLECIFPNQPKPDGGTCSDDEALLTQVLTFLRNLAGILAVLVFMYGGYKYFFGGLTGDAAGGKNAIIAGAVGLVIVLMATIIENLIRGSVTEDGLDSGGIIQFIQEDVVNNFLLPLSSIAAVAVIIFGGYKYMTSGLSSDQKDGLDTVKNGVIGLVVVLLAYPIGALIKSILPTGTEEGESGVVLETSPIVELALNIINGFLIPLSSVISVLFLVLGAYYYMTSNGSEDGVKKGRDAIKNAVIGLVVTLLAATIVQIIVYFIPISGAETPAETTTAFLFLD